MIDRMIIGISDLLLNLFVTRKKRAQVFLSLFRHLSKSSLLTILVNVLLVARSKTFFCSSSFLGDRSFLLLLSQSLISIVFLFVNLEFHFATHN